MTSQIRVEVVHALSTRQVALTVILPEGATVRDAIEASGIATLVGLEAIDLERVGIWNRVVTADAMLADGDRVELHRPLIADPKDARRRRARAVKLA